MNLRDEYPALRYGDYYNLEADKNIFAYIRSYMSQRILIVINKSEDPQSVELNIPELYGIKSITNLVNNESIGVDNSKLNIKIDGTSWQMFELK